MIILTGGAGFIGSATLGKLNEMGHDNILIVDNLGSTEKWKNLVGKKFADYIHKTEFLKRLDNKAYFEDATSVIHFGACSSTTEHDMDYLMQNNFRYSQRLAEWALARDLRFIYASSAATYGDGANAFSDDDVNTPKLKPINRYGYSKHLFDLWILRENIQNRIAGLKFFNVFGPNEYHKGDMRSLIHKAFIQIQETGKIRLFKSHRNDYRDGEQVRDFIYIKDCVNIIDWLLQTPQANGIMNLGTGKARSWNDLAKAIFDAMRVKPNVEYFDMPEILRSAYQYRTEAEISKLQGMGCPVVFQSLEDSVKDYVTKYLMKSEYL